METQIEIDTLLCFLRQELERIDQSILALELMALAPGAPIGARPPIRRTADRHFAQMGARKAWSTHRTRRD